MKGCVRKCSNKCPPFFQNESFPKITVTLTFDVTLTRLSWSLEDMISRTPPLSEIYSIRLYFEDPQLDILQ